MSPLYIAGFNDNIGIVQVLIAAGADMNKTIKVIIMMLMCVF